MSETTTTTGWHRHEKTGTIHQAAACFLDDAHPVIWLDPADPAVRETITRTVRLVLSWPADSGYGIADAVLAALASATEGAGA